MRLSRAAVVLAAAVAGVALLVVSTRPWLTGVVNQPLGSDGRLDVAGGSAAGVVPALALVGLACAGALTIARRAGQLVALALLALAGAGALAATLQVLADPPRAARATVAEVMGRTVGSVTTADATVALTAWPLVACVLAALLVVVAGLGWTTRRTWRTSARFEAARATAVEAPVPPHSSGAVPVASSTAGCAADATSIDATPSVDASPGIDTTSASDTTSAAHTFSTADTWDALTRGDDPTRGPE